MDWINRLPKQHFGYQSRAPYRASPSAPPAVSLVVSTGLAAAGKFFGNFLPTPGFAGPQGAERDGSVSG